MQSYSVGAIHLNEVLQRWITQLSHDSVPTLFLLEWAQDGFVPAIYEEDTIPMLKKLSSQCTGKVEFRCADYRTTAIKSFGPEFWYPFAQEISRNFENRWGTFCLETYREAMITFYGAKAVTILEKFTASQFLIDVRLKLKEIEVALMDIKDSKQQAILSQYHIKISESYIALETFFTKHLKSLDMPYYLAFVNSVSQTNSPAEIKELYKKYMLQITMNIADAGFFIEVINAINNGKYARVVTYTGLKHMTELEKNLFDVYNVEPNWLGLTIPHTAQGYYKKVGTRVLISELCEPAPENPELFIGNMDPGSLCLKLGVEYRGPSPLQRSHIALQKCVEEVSLPPQQQANITLKQCNGCKKQETQQNQFQRCGKCKKVYYCSKECQRRDWPNHKKTCNP